MSEIHKVNCESSHCMVESIFALGLLTATLEMKVDSRKKLESCIYMSSFQPFGTVACIESGLLACEIPSRRVCLACIMAVNGMVTSKRLKLPKGFS